MQILFPNDKAYTWASVSRHHIIILYVHSTFGNIWPKIYKLTVLECSLAYKKQGHMHLQDSIENANTCMTQQNTSTCTCTVYYMYIIQYRFKYTCTYTMYLLVYVRASFYSSKSVWRFPFTVHFGRNNRIKSSPVTIMIHPSIPSCW